jgi:acetyl esterase/lipase
MPIDRRTLIRAAPATVAAALDAGTARAAPPAQETHALVPPNPKETTPPPKAAAAAVSSPAKSASPAPDDAETIKLWAGDPPGAPVAMPDAKLRKGATAGHSDVKLTGVAVPVLFVYRPVKPNGVGLIVMPGGGYRSLSLQNEGTNVARVFNERGWTVFVLSYRLPGEGWLDRSDVPLQDAVRAMRLVRARSSAFGVDPKRLGVLGFSAGGHLAASLAVAPDDPVYAPRDAADRLPAVPSFVGLVYPVTTLQPPCAETASHKTLLGPDPTPALVARRSPLLHVGKATPPSFLVHALDDPIVDPACSIAWLQACRASGIPVEAQFIEKGGHGFGMKLAQANPGAVWPDQFRLWAARHGG